MALVDDDAADRHRLQPRHRRQRSGAADLDVDAFQDRHRLLGGKFVRGRPAWTARAEAEPFLQVEPIDLVDDAVDVVGQLRTLGLDRVIVRQDRFDRIAAHHAVVDLEAPVAEAADHIELRGAQRLAGFAPGIGEEFERPRLCHLRVELAKASGCGIARIGEDAARFRHALVAAP